MIEDLIKISEQNNTGIITLSRPKALNALNYKMAEIFLKKLINWNKNSSIKRVLVEGKGNAFCAGGDIKSLVLSKNKDEIRVLSKIKLNEDYKIISNIFEEVNLEDKDSLNSFIKNLKIVYEDNWKSINKINTSIKLPMTVFLPSKDYNKIQLFEKTLNDLDLVSDFYVLHFDNKNVFYKVIYNGPPNKFLGEFNEKGLKIIKNEDDWQIK